MAPMGGRRSRRRARPRHAGLIVLCVGLLGSSAGPARAFDLSPLLSADLAGADWVGSADVFAGVDASQSALFSYGGFTLAPGHPDREGLRFRLYAGAGHYQYTSRGRSSRYGAFKMERKADVLQAEALIGWQISTGAMTAKMFTGLAYEEQTISPGDPGNTLAGEHFGAKAALETWFDLASWAWLSADASYATMTDAYSGTVKLGVRPWSWLSIGPEAAAFGNAEFDGHRLGGFARWHCGGCDVTVSGGVSGDYDDDTGAYGALSLYRRF